MDNLLGNYFQNRMERESETVEEIRDPGPVITLSREYGCPGNYCGVWHLYRRYKIDFAGNR